VSVATILELEKPGPPRGLLREGSPPPPGPAPAPETPPSGSITDGGWTEERARSVVSYAWQYVGAPALQFGLGANDEEVKLHRFEADILIVLAQSSLNRHVPLTGDQIRPENADRALIGVLIFILATRALRIYNRRGELGPVRAGDVERQRPRAAAATPPTTPPAPRPEPTATPPAASNGENRLGGVIGDGRTLVDSAN